MQARVFPQTFTSGDLEDGPGGWIRERRDTSGWLGPPTDAPWWPGPAAAAAPPALAAGRAGFKAARAGRNATFMDGLVLHADWWILPGRLRR